MKLVRKFIAEILHEAWNPKTGGFDTVQNSREDEAELQKKEKRISRNATFAEYGSNVESALDGEINALRASPEYANIEAFVTYKLDDEDLTFNTTDIQALARNEDYSIRRIPNALPPASVTEKIKGELLALGLEFKPREKVRNFRGSMSAAHGASPFAGTVGGGSGMGSGREGPIGFGIGGGPGAIGGGYEWNANDPKNLGMSAKRKK
jgi:hypothetical protein